MNKRLRLKSWLPIVLGKNFSENGKMGEEWNNFIDVATLIPVIVH